MFFSNITDYYKDKFMLSYGTLLTAVANYRYKASTKVNFINNNIDRADIFWLIFLECLGKKRGTILSVGLYLQVALRIVWGLWTPSFSAL